MSLLQEIEEDKKALAKLESEEEDQQTEESTEESEEDGDSEETAPEENGEDSGDEDGSGEAEESKEESAEANIEEEQKPDNAGYGRLRRENKALEDKIKELTEQINGQAPQPQAVQQKQEEVASEPDLEKDPVAWLQWNKNRVDALESQIEEQNSKAEEQTTYQNAREGFANIEREFVADLTRAGVDDYEDVSSFLASQIAGGIRALNPHISAEELGRQTEQEILVRGANYFKRGLNPAEELYHEAKEIYGFKPSPKAEEAPKEEEVKVKPDLDKVAKNRKRNAGTAGASSTGGKPQVTREVAAGMTMLEFSKLPPAKRKQLLNAE